VNAEAQRNPNANTTTTTRYVHTKRMRFMVLRRRVFSGGRPSAASQKTRIRLPYR
jgi:hypothetical protein